MKNNTNLFTSYKRIDTEVNVDKTKYMSMSGDISLQQCYNITIGEKWFENVPEYLKDTKRVSWLKLEEE
jgi:hypothetical protein